MRRALANTRSWPDLVVASVLLGLLAAALPALPGQDAALEELSFDQLLDVEIVSASRVVERLSEAPATVIVISRQQIVERGYTELTEILERRRSVELISLLADLPTRLDRIATFLAVLEMIRLQMLVAFQRALFGEIRIARVQESEADAGAPAGPAEALPVTGPEDED